MPTYESRKDKTGKNRIRAKVRVAPFPTEYRTFDRKEDAKLWAEQRHAELRRRKQLAGDELDLDVDTHTLGYVIDRFIETQSLKYKSKTHRKTIVQQLRWWQGRLGNKKLAQVRPRDIRKARNDLLEAPTENTDINGEPVLRWEGNRKRSLRRKSPKTVVHYLNALSVVFSYAIEQDWIPHNPVREVKKPKVNNARQRFLSPDAFLFPGDSAPQRWNELDEYRKTAAPETAYELPRYLEACRKQRRNLSYHPEWLYNVSVLRIATGMRPSEAEGLEWSRVHLHAEEPHLILVDTKNGQPLNVPLFGEALRILKDMHVTRRLDTDFVFPRKDGLKPLSFRYRYARAFKDAGLKDFKRHDLRHTAASYLAMRGASAKEVADILNQKSTAMAERYMHLSPGHTRTRVQDMNKAFLHRSLFKSPPEGPTPTTDRSVVRVQRKTG